MKVKVTLFMLLMVVAAGCTAAGNSESSAGEFSEPLSNQVEVHDHDTAAEANGHHHGGDHQHEHLDEATSTAEVQVVLVPSELAVGENRMAVGLLDGDKQMIHDAQVHFHYFDLADPAAPQLEQEVDAQRLQAPDGYTTIYAHSRTFDRAGEWGLEVQVHLADGQTAVERIGFHVASESVAIRPGDIAPSLKTPTLTTVDGEFERITSAWEPNPAFYQLSLDEALSSGKPTVLLLATPAFCQTRFCGPAYEILSDLQARSGETANFVHVEVYSGLPDPTVNDWALSPAMDAFGLSTEPWVYVMGSDGRVLYRAEGVFTPDEIEAFLPS